MRALSAAVVLASISMIGQQAHAGEKIVVSSSKVSDKMKDLIRERMNDREARAMIHQMSENFAQSVVIDGRSDFIDVRAYLANKQDSTNARGGDEGAVVGYSACHRACHGSRSWR